MVFNQDFVPGWNALYSNILNKVSKTIITANVYQSPFSQMLQDMETGTYVEDIHINPGAVLLQDTVINSDILNDYVDDLATAVYAVNVDLVYPSTYKEYVVRQANTVMQNVSALISALTANIRVTLEYHRNELVKQMLFNAYEYGMLSSTVISDPRLSREASGRFAVALNVTIDDFRTELNKRNVIYNNQLGIAEEDKRLTISSSVPYVIIFNEFVRDVEFMNAINLGLIEKFRSGNSNMDWQNRIIPLNLEDWPKTIPSTDRSAVTGANVSAKNINFFEMPVDAQGNDLFSGVRTGGDTICGFVIDPDAIKLFTQLSVQTNFLNAATLANTNREIYRGIMELGAFNKIKVITCNAGQEA